MIQQQEHPAMMVTKLEGFVTRKARRYVVDKESSTPEKKRYMMEEKDEKIPAGYLITFSKGHAIRVDEQELERLKARFSDPNGYVESEKVANADMAQVMRAAGGNPLVNVIVEQGAAK